MPPPGWPQSQPGSAPPPEWVPDPSLPNPPAGWAFYRDDLDRPVHPPAGAWLPYAPSSQLADGAEPIVRLVDLPPELAQAEAAPTGDAEPERPPWMWITAFVLIISAVATGGYALYFHLG